MENLRSTVLLAGLIAIGSFSVPVQAKYGGGSGEPNDPYLIYDANQLNAIGAEPNDWDMCFQLRADIDLGDYQGQQFNIIGADSGNPFRGIFDGNDHRISNLNYSSTAIHRVGLFGYVSGESAEIKNLRLIDPNVDAGTYDYAGSLVGYLRSGTITNCYVDGGSVAGDYYVGGLVGRNSSGTITNCYVDGGRVTGDNNVGGLVGDSSSGTITNCYVDGGRVTGEDRVGGLVGGNSSGTMTDCSATGNVAGDDNVGGLVGRNSSGTITNCSATGETVGADNVGGLSGYSSGAISNCCATTTTRGNHYVGGLLGDNSGAITYSYAAGIVEGDSQVGGLVGRNHGSIVNCYSNGAVTAEEFPGGLVGYSYEARVINSYWDLEASGQEVSAAGQGKTSDEMTMASTFYGWGFCGAVWRIDEGISPPTLAWEEKPGEFIAGEFHLDGNGDSNSPYLIHTPEELNSIGSVPCAWDKHFKLAADIDLSAYKGEEFNVIGFSSYDAFSGVFDGNDHGIWNLAYSSTATDYIGLFGWVGGENAEIKNLTLIDPNVDAGTGDYVGSLVGRFSDGTVANCSAQGGNITGYNCVGGLIGSADSATVTGCSATAAVLGCNSVGGLVGNVGGRVGRGSASSGIVAGSYATGTVAGYDNVGGLAGGVSGAVAKSYATGSVWAERYVGGLIGNSYATVEESYATGPVVGGEYAGGLVGYNNGPITNCYTTGDVWADEYVGGLVGQNNAAVADCYSTGAVWASNHYYLGGLIGYGASSDVENSFWNTEIDGLLTSRGGTGLTTAALQAQTTFTDAGWDFVGEDENGSEDIWRLCNQGSEYPKLAWQYLDGDFLCPDYVDFLDFAHLGRWWLKPDPCAADLTGDGLVNAQDLIVESHNWLLGMLPGRPGNPDPPNFAKQARWYADLAWSPDPFAQSYDVYFGPANPPAFVRNQAATTFWPGMMEYQRSYYWRIDGVNTWGKTAGPVWTFTTASPAEATNPYPFDGQMNASANTGLRWDAGSGAVSHDIYFGTTNPPPFLRNQTGASFYPEGLTSWIRYYWRIDEVNAGGTTTGVVWSFTTIGALR